MKLKFLLTLFLIFNIIVGNSQTLQPNSQVRKVYVIFKTHLDVGFTNLSSVVTQRYIHEFIPKAIDVAEKMKSDGSGDRYVWTTGSWLIWKYLQEATEEDIKRLDKAIQEGDIIWNAVPYTVESETMNRDLFNSCLQLSKELERQIRKAYDCSQNDRRTRTYTRYHSSTDQCRNTLSPYRSQFSLPRS